VPASPCGLRPFRQRPLAACPGRPGSWSPSPVPCLPARPRAISPSFSASAALFTRLPLPVRAFRVFAPWWGAARPPSRLPRLRPAGLACPSPARSLASALSLLPALASLAVPRLWPAFVLLSLSPQFDRWVELRGFEPPTCSL
jgi:hypothetical protein